MQAKTAQTVRHSGAQRRQKTMPFHIPHNHNNRSRIITEAEVYTHGCISAGRKLIVLALASAPAPRNVQGRAKKIPQHKNYDISEMHAYFSSKFCSFVQKTTAQKCAVLCCIYLTYAKLTETQTSRTSFATVQTIQKSILLK